MCYDNEPSLSNLNTGHRSRDRMIVGQPPMQSVPVTTIIVSSNPTQGIQHYVLMCVGDLRQVCGFFPALHFPPPIKLTAKL